MTSHFNLPPGVSPTDIPGNDPDECPTCEGLGTVDGTTHHDKDAVTCPTCGGLGVVDSRTKEGQDVD